MMENKGKIKDMKQEEADTDIQFAEIIPKWQYIAGGTFLILYCTSLLRFLPGVNKISLLLEISLTAVFIPVLYWNSYNE